jgi:pimeloyl-ACP methyl ester carboxylesterase
MPSRVWSDMNVGNPGTGRHATDAGGPVPLLPRSSEERTSARVALLRAALRVLTFASLPLAARAAGALFRLPPRRRKIAEEERALAEARHERISTAAGDSISTWRWGEGPPILLVHGWGSRGARLASFVPSLLDAGFAAVTFDAPAHGASAGWLSSAPQFVGAIEAAAARFGPFRALIAHSMGGCASALAMRRGLSVERAVFIAPAANPGAFSQEFARFLRLPEPVMDLMKRRFERKFGYPWEEFDVPRIAGDFTAPLLVFHDREDRDVPWTDGAAIARAWPGAHLVTTSGLGHRRVVDDPALIQTAVEFLGAPPIAVGTRTSTGETR